MAFQERVVRVRVPSQFHEDVEKDVMIAYAIDLFVRGKVSLGKGAELAGLSYHKFLEELRKRGYPAYTYSEEDLKEDLNFD